MPQLTGFNVLNLHDLLQVVEKGDSNGEKRIAALLSSFSCPYNKDVEYFLHKKAIIFDRQSVSRTYLVLTSYQGSPVVVGYFALATKIIEVNKKALSRKDRDKMKRFSNLSRDANSYLVAAPLIGQLSKNYSNGVNTLISGQDLLALAIEKVEEQQLIGGGRFVYLECEDKAKLISFYTQNGFLEFGQRTKTCEEQGYTSGILLKQLIRRTNP